MRLVDYVIARDCVPPRRGLAYDYIVAGDGLFLAAENRFFAARVPVAAAKVRGLPPIYPAFTLWKDRLRPELWERIVSLCRAWGEAGHEVLLAVTHDENTGYQLVMPNQVVSAIAVRYLPVADVILEIHSHHRYPARFSPTDDADEQRLCLYGVLGRLDGERPEVALRVGAYGHFLPVPWGSVFQSDLGGFRDVGVEPTDEDDDDGQLSG
jgi:PRTRC genetic system protein A